jgi:hypothetical protein
MASRITTSPGEGAIVATADAATSLIIARR